MIVFSFIFLASKIVKHHLALGIVRFCRMDWGIFLELCKDERKMSSMYISVGPSSTSVYNQVPLLYKQYTSNFHLLVGRLFPCQCGKYPPAASAFFQFYFWCCILASGAFIDYCSFCVLDHLCHLAASFRTMLSEFNKPPPFSYCWNQAIQPKQIKDPLLLQSQHKYSTCAVSVTVSFLIKTKRGE